MTILILATIAACLWAGIVFDPHEPMLYAWRLAWLPLALPLIGLLLLMASVLTTVLMAGRSRLHWRIKDNP